MRLTGLDGLRAIAVVAVLLFHADLPFAQGGYLGVDLFFVISGFLITSLLASEFQAHGRIRLGEFFWRRAKRLLPAFGLMVAGAIIAASIWAPDALPRLRDDTLASILYVTNWKFIYFGQTYFESMGREPLLLHLWSLAIEEQFYLFWAPLVFFALPHVSRRVLALLAITIAVASIAWMAVGASAAEPNMARLYFGTDTHGFGLLIGAALGLLWRPGALKSMRTRANVAFSAIGALLGLGLIALMVTLGEQSEWLYPWGFVATSLLSALIIAMATLPKSYLGTLLDNRVMRWLGERSYGIYLWHWPIFMITRPELDVQGDPVSIFLLRIVLTLGIAALSYRFVEMPIRQSKWAGMGSLSKAFAIVPTAAIVTIASSMLFLAPSQAEPPKDVVASLQEDASVDEPPVPSTKAEAPVSESRPPFVAEPVLTAIGDSVLLGAKKALKTAMPKARVYAAVSKQAATVVKELQDLRQKNALTPIVVIHLGTNGYVTEKQLREMLTILDKQDLVVVMNSRVPRKWMRANNALMERVVPEYKNAKLADWNALSENRPEYFVSDGVHLTTKGQKAFLAGIQSAIQDSSTRPSL